MIRHFLGVAFSSLIAFILFVNLFQFSGASFPITTGYTQMTTDNTSGLFGLTSIFNFVESLGTNQAISLALDSIKVAFKLVATFSVENIIEIFNGIPKGNFSFIDILKVLTNILKLLFDGIVLPFVVLFSLVLVVFSVILFAYSLLSCFAALLLGRYNYNPIPSGLLESTAYIIPYIHG